MVVCKICGKECETLDFLRKHSAVKHKIKSEDTYIDYVLNGVRQIGRAHV